MSSFGGFSAELVGEWRVLRAMCLRNSGRSFRGLWPLTVDGLTRFVLALSLLVAGFVLMFWASGPGTMRRGFSNEHNFSALLMTIFIETRIWKQVEQAPFPRLGGERKLVKVRLANG